MTNAEKYEEVFGFKVDKVMCPVKGCENCPCTKCTDTEKWWDSEYRGLKND